MDECVEEDGESKENFDEVVVVMEVVRRFVVRYDVVVDDIGVITSYNG